MRIRHTLLRPLALCAAVALGAAPARAQWSQIPGTPTTEFFSAWASGDTITAGADTAVYVSTDAGASWHVSTKPVAGVTSIQATRILDHRLYAGTFGQGVFVSDDLGASWQGFNQGLTGGILDSQLDVTDLEVREGTLYAATAGAGVYARDLAGSNWQPFGAALEPNQAPNVNSIALGGTRLIASAGSNGMVFFHDPGDADWNVSNLDNIGVHAGIDAMMSIWTGSVWVVGTNLGLFTSAAGAEPWTRVDPGFGVLDWTAFASQGGHLYAAFDLPLGVVIEESGDGATWQLDEGLANVFVKELAISGGSLYAARGDGLWERAIGSVAAVRGGPNEDPSFALAGPQPFRDSARLSFALREPGPAAIDFFDAQGRVAAPRIAGPWSAGSHAVTLDAQRLAPGVYLARLTAGRVQKVVRLVHLQ